MGGTGKTDKTARREERLAEALRRNLRRRKDQARRRKAEQTRGPDKTPGKQ